MLRVVSLLISRWLDSATADLILEAERAPSVQTTCLETPPHAASVSHACVVTIAEETQICETLSELFTGVLCLHISEIGSTLQNLSKKCSRERIYSGKMIQTKHKWPLPSPKVHFRGFSNIPSLLSTYLLSACQCDLEGTLAEGCNKQTGACLCRPGVTGSRCTSCSRGHCDSFPLCESCPSCFFTLDSQRQNLSLILKSITTRFPTTPDSSNVNFGLRILALENRLKLLRESISFPPSIARQVDDALTQLDKLRWGSIFY